MNYKKRKSFNPDGDANLHPKRTYIRANLHPKKRTYIRKVKGANLHPKGANLHPKGVNLQPKRANLHPKGANLDPKGANLDPIFCATRFLLTIL